MRRSIVALLLAFAGLAVAIVWLVDPLGWRAQALNEEATAQRAEAKVALEEPRPQLQRAAQQDSGGESSAPDRQVIQAAPSETRAVFQLANAAGEAQRNARIVVVRGSEVLFDGTTDEAGRVALDADGEEAVLAARCRMRRMQLWNVRLESGLRELVLDEGSRVAGRIESETGSAVQGVFLQLQCDRPLLPKEPVPEAVWTALGIKPSQSVYLATQTDERGQFEFSGLPPTWSGSMWIAGWRMRSASRGEVLPLASGLKLDAPAEDLVIVLAARAELRGRLLAASDGSPLAGASLCAELRGADEQEPQMKNTLTDGEGRFHLASRGAVISAFELRLGNLFEESLPILALEGTAVPLDGELGDLFVEGVRDVRFLLHDSAGTPIRGGLARAAGIQSEPTDGEGRSVLRCVPASAKQLWAEAQGFVPREIALGPAVADPLLIQLEPASLLEVRLIPPEGGSLAQFKVVLRREEGVIAGPARNKAQQAAYVDTPSLPTADLWRAPVSSFLVALAKEPLGVATFRALAIGVPLELEVRGLTGPEVFWRQTLEPFRAGETRRIEIALGEGLVAFRGHVLDAAGAPLERATVQIDGAILGWTDENGAFSYFLVDAGPGTLVLQHEACSTLFLHDYVVPAGGQEVEFRLQPARGVTIEVVDENGDPVPEAEVWILQEGFVSNTFRIEGNRHSASSLTDNPFQIEVRLGGRKFVQVHAPDQPEARVVVPVHGSVLARVPDMTTRSRAGKMQLILQPAEGQGGEPLIASQASQPDLALGIAAVFPGSYQASLHYVPSDDELAAGRQEEQSVPVPITVQAKQRTEVQLAL